MKYDFTPAPPTAPAAYPGVEIHLIEAIKLFRAATGEGIRNSKDFIERNLRANSRGYYDTCDVGRMIKAWYDEAHLNSQ